MKKITVVFFVFFSLILSAQNPSWNVIATVEPYPTSFYSEWQKNSSTSFITLTYSDIQSTEYKIRFVLKNSSGKELVRFTSPLLTFASGPASAIYYPQDFLNWSDNKYDNETLQKILRTNRFPEGFYEETVTVLSTSGTVLATGNANFTIVYPDSPVLFDPQNGVAENRLSPIFMWATVNLPPGMTFKYNLKIVKRFPGQSITQALKVNPIFHEADIENNNSYVYPLSSQQFENGQEYAWRVRVIDVNGNPLTANDGNSEFWSFNYLNESSGGSQLPFSSVELEKNVAWFTDFSRLEITSDAQNYKIRGSTTLYLKLSDGQLREFAAQIQDLTFAKNRYNPFVFNNGTVVANLPAGAIPTDLITGQFTPLSVEYNTAEKLFLKGEVTIPGTNPPLKLPGLVPIKPGGVLEATIKYGKGSRGQLLNIPRFNIQRSGFGGEASISKIVPTGNRFNQAVGFLSKGETPQFPATDTIYSFGNSAIKIIITGYELVYPAAIAKFSGELRAFNDHVLATLSNIQFNEAGELTGSINTNTATEFNFIPAQVGKYVLKIDGVSGTFSFHPTTKVSSIDISLKNPTFKTNVTGLFKNALKGSATASIKLLHSSYNSVENGMKVSSLSAFALEGSTLAENPISLGSATLLEINSLQLDSLVQTDSGLDFRMRLDVKYKFTGLNLISDNVVNVPFTKQGISIPLQTGLSLFPVTGTGTSRSLNGFIVEYRGLTANAAVWNGGTELPTPRLAGKLKFSNFPIGSSENLFLSSLDVTTDFTANGFSITLPTQSYSSSFIAIGGDLKYKLKSMSGEITGILSDSTYTISSAVKAKGNTEIVANTFGNTTVQELVTGTAELALDGFGKIRGTINGLENTNSLSRGAFPLTVSGYSLQFSVTADSQSVEASGSGQINLSSLTGGNQKADFTFIYSMKDKSWKSFNGSYGSITLNFPTSGTIFKYSTDQITISNSGFTINGRGNATFGTTGTTGATADNVIISYNTGKVSAGRIILDRGPGISVNISNGLSSPSFSFGAKSGTFPSAGVTINSSNNIEYNSVGLVISSGTDTAYLVHKGRNYRTVSSFENLTFNGLVTEVVSGRVNLLFGSVIVASLSQQGLIVDESKLPSLPEKLVLLNSNIAFLKVKNGETELVDWTIEGDNLRIKNKPGQTVIAYFPSLKGNGTVVPEVPVNVNILLDKTNYDITDGSIQATFPSASSSGFDLTSRNIPLKLKSFSYTKASTNLYELTFKSAVAPFGETLNSEDVQVQMLSSGVISGDISFSVGKNYYMRSGSDADKIILQVNTVSGSFSADVLTSTTPEYRLEITGGIKLKLSATGYRGAAAKFIVTQSGIEIMDFVQDDFSFQSKFDLGKIKLQISSFRLASLSYTQGQGWKYNIGIDAGYYFRVPDINIEVPTVNNIKISEAGITFPVTQKNGLETATRAIDLNRYSIILRNFRSNELKLSSLDTLAFNPDNSSFRFDFTVKFPNFPANYPSPLKNGAIYVQNAKFENGFIKGSADSVVYSPMQSIIFNTDGRITITEIAGEFRVDNNKQSFDVQVEGFVKLPSINRASGWISIPVDSFRRFSISGNGMITGTYNSGADVTVRSGRAFYSVKPGNKVTLSVENNVQVIRVGATDFKAGINMFGADTAKGSGNTSFDLTANKMGSGGIILTPSFSALLPANKSVFNFTLNNAELSSAGVNVTGVQKLNVGTQKIDVTFTNYTLNSSTLNNISGSFTLRQSIAFSVAPVNSELRWEAVNSSFIPSINSSASFTLPSLTVTGNKAILSGTSTGKVKFDNQVYSDFQVQFENNPEVDFSIGKVTKGSIVFYKGATKAAFIDATGLNLTGMGSVALPEKLILGNLTVAYLKLKSGETKNVITETVSTGLRIRNNTNGTVPLIVPGLKYTAQADPQYNVTVDVIVNPTTYSVISGSITHQAPTGQSLADLNSYGIPLRVTKLKYENGTYGYTFTADGITSLPAPLRLLEVELTNIGFLNGRLNGIVSKGAYSSTYNPSGGYLKMLKVGSMSEFKLQSVDYNFGTTPSFKISGDIKSKLFKSGTDTSNIHFIASYANGSYQFTPSTGSSDGLKISKFNFIPVTIDNNPGMALSFSSDNFRLILNGTMKAPEISTGFETSIKNLTVSKDSAKALPVNITAKAQEQSFTIFGSEVILKNTDNIPAIAFSYNRDTAALNLTGTIAVLGKILVLKNFRVTGEGVITLGQALPVSAATPLAIIADVMKVTSVTISNESSKYLLNIGGQLLLPKPAVQTWQNFAFKIKANQSLSETVTYPVINEAPGIGNDNTEPKFWAGKYDLQYAALNIDFSEISASQIQTVSIFYVDSISTHRYIKFGKVEGGTIEPGMSINFEKAYEWTEELDFADEVKFTYNNLKYDIDAEDVEFEPDTTNGSFLMKIGGSVQLGVTGFTGSLNFSGLEIRSDNTVKKFKESITGGTVTIAPLITVEITRLAFSSSPTDIYMPDPNGTKVASGPDKGKVVVIKVPVKFYLALGGTVQLGKFAEGGVDSLLVFQKTDGTINFVINNFNFRKKDKIEFRLSMSLLTGTGGDFLVSMAGFCDFNGKVLAAYGKVAKWNGKFSAGLFVAALEGVEVSFFGLVDLAGIGGGFFFNPTENDIRTVRDFCGFTDEYTSGIKEKIKGRPVTDNPLFTIFIYARIEFGQPVPPANEPPLAGNALLTIANDRLIIDAKVEALGRRHELYGLANVEVSFTQKFVEGTISMTVDLRYVLTANATLQFFYYSQKNWGVIGSMQYSVLLNMLNGNGDFYAGSKGFYAAATFNQGFDVWIVSVNGGLALKAWYKPDVSWGAYFRLTLEASVLGGIASARGEIKGVLIGAPNFALAGGASLAVRLLFVKWNGDVWIRLSKEGVKAGFGKDEAVQRLIATAEGMSNDFLAAVNAAKSEMQNNKPMPSLNITKEILDSASAQLVRRIMKARSLTDDDKLSQADKDSLRLYLTSELAGGEDATLRNYLTRLQDNIISAKTDSVRNELRNLLNDLNNATTEFKNSISQVTQAVSNLSFTTEVPSAVSPEGVTDPVESARFVWPATRDTLPQPNDPSFSINNTTAGINNTIVNTYINDAQGYHDMLKRNIEKIEAAITKFDRQVSNANGNIYLGITFKYATVYSKTQEYIKRLAQYHYDDMVAMTNFRSAAISDTGNFYARIKAKDISDGGTVTKIKVYKRWARIRGLAGLNSNPWDGAEFDGVWGRFNADQKALEGKLMAQNLYMVVPDQAFFKSIGLKKTALSKLHSEFVEKIDNVEEFAATYTAMLDELYAKRRKMSENLFEVVERFIYWKDQAKKSNKDITTDFQNVVPTLATLKTKKTAIVNSNTAPAITVNNAVITNKNSHTEINLTWNATHADGIVEYALESNYLPGGFKSIGIFNFWYPYVFQSNTGLENRYIQYRVRARAKSGFTKTAILYSGLVSVGVSDKNIGAPAQTVTTTAPVDETIPYWSQRPKIDDAFLFGTPNQIFKPFYSFSISGNHVFQTYKTNEFRLRYTAYDNESGISNYRYQVLYRDATDNWTVIRDWENIGAINEYLIQGLNLKHCATERELRYGLGNQIPRYVIAIEANNGAGKKNFSFATILVDTSTPPPLTANGLIASKEVRGITNYHQGTVYPSRFDTSTNTSSKPIREDREIVFDMDRAGHANSGTGLLDVDYYYNVFAMPDGIKINDSYIIDKRIYQVNARGKTVIIPDKYYGYDQFKLEIMYRTRTGRYSPIYTTTSWYYPFESYPRKYTWNSGFRGGTSTIDAYPDPPTVYWFNDKSQQGVNNLKLYFQNYGRSLDGSGNNGFYYAIGTLHSLNTEYTVNQLTWTKMPPIQENGIVTMDARFFAPYSRESWFVPGGQFYVYIKAVNNTMWAARNITIVGPILLAPPTVSNISVDIVKDSSLTPKKYTAVLTIDRENEATTKTYFVRTQVQKNGVWSDPTSPLQSGWKEVRSVFGVNNWHLTTKINLNTISLMPLRDMNATGTYFQNLGQRWRIQIKTRDNGGNESDIVNKELIW